KLNFTQFGHPVSLTKYSEFFPHYFTHALALAIGLLMVGTAHTQFYFMYITILPPCITSEPHISITDYFIRHTEIQKHLLRQLLNNLLCCRLPLFQGQ